MSEQEIQASLDKFQGLVDSFVSTSESDINFLDSQVREIQVKLSTYYEYMVTSNSAVLVQGATIVYFNACYSYLRALMPRSPQWIEIASAIWTGIMWLLTILDWIRTVVDTLHLLEIYRLLMLVWPEFRKKMEMIQGKIAELSYHLGWGVDGIGHLLQAVQSGINTIGGLRKKTPFWMEVDFADQYIVATKTYAANLDYYAENPSALMDIVFTTGSQTSRQEIDNWWRETQTWIGGIAEIAETAATGMGRAINELRELRMGMPEFIAHNIPQSIWDGLNKADALIYENILPAVQVVKDKLAVIDNILDQYRNRMSDLASRLAMPGDILLGVDEMSEALKISQEQAIDNVASREFQRQADADRILLIEDIDAFDLIDAAMSAPTPPPVFMTIEDPKRRAILGIKYEPGETWFLAADL